MAKLSRKVKAKRILQGLIRPTNKDAIKIALKLGLRNVDLSDHYWRDIVDPKSLRDYKRAEIVLEKIEGRMDSHLCRYAAAFALDALGVANSRKKKQAIDLVVEYMRRAQIKEGTKKYQKHINDQFFDNMEKVIGTTKTGIFIFLYWSKLEKLERKYHSSL